MEKLPAGRVSEAAVARELNLSQRSLQRRLREQGTSFNELLDGIRHELSGQYVTDSSRSFTEIAFLLGFSEPSNFARAFKRWHGVAPGAFRARALGAESRVH